MATDTRRAIDTLNGLIAICKDGENGYRSAAKDAGMHETLRELFDAQANQRAAFATELLTEVHRLDSLPEREGTTAGSLHRCWLNMQSILSRRKEKAVLTVCERGERKALKQYEAALKRKMPPEVLALVERQCTLLREMYAQIRLMKTVAKLNELLSVCVDAEKGYRVAAAHVRDSNLEELFRNCAEQRRQFGLDLHRAFCSVGDVVQQKGTLAALFHRGWMKVRAMVTLGSATGVLAECGRGERAAARRYRSALKMELIPGLRTLIEQQYAAIQETQATLHSLKAAAKRFGAHSIHPSAPPSGR